MCIKIRSDETGFGSLDVPLDRETTLWDLRVKICEIVNRLADSPVGPGQIVVKRLLPQVKEIQQVEKTCLSLGIKQNSCFIVYGVDRNRPAGALIPKRKPSTISDLNILLLYQLLPPLRG